MSNYLAIAAVTATLRDLVQEAALAVIPGAIVSTARPDNALTQNKDRAAINLFLYRIAPNAALNNSDLPTRTGNGLYLRKPRIAIDLDYIFSFQGVDTTLDAQRLLGSILIALHTQPFLTADNIRNAINANAVLSQADLFDQAESVKFEMLNQSTEELSKLWSVFFQVPYALSVAYRASVVLIEADVTLAPIKPVLDRNIAAKPGVASS